jgi:transglutaminase-like putative cysteine protease
MEDADVKRTTDRSTGLIARLIGALGPRAVLTWSLLLAVIFTMVAGLTSAVENLDAVLLATVAVVATTLGWLLALLPVRAGQGSLLLATFGVEFLLVRVGRLGDSLWRIIVAAGRFIWDLALWYWTEIPPDPQPLPRLYLELWQDMATLIGRTFAWISDLAAGNTTVDPVGLAIVWGVAVWVYNAWAGWVVRRHHRPLLAVLPGSILLSFVLSYTGANPYIFLPILGFTLVLMALTGQQAREQSWASAGVDYSQGLFGDVGLAATGVSIALVVAAAIAPSISVQEVADWVREVTDRGPEAEARTDAVAESLGLEQTPEPRAPRPLEVARATGLPQRHLIGSGPELSRRVVMVVETGELPEFPGDLELFAEAPPRHYWRSLTYDRYLSRGWATSATESAEYEAGQPITEPEGDHLRTLRQRVQVIGEGVGSLVHVDGTLVSVDQEFEVAWRPPGEIFAASTPALVYRADSVYPSVTADQLRGASTVYPEWILARYLQLPENMPARVLALSRDLTATQPTPYDRAMAIEGYLREFPYNLNVPMPGAGEDIADFFLFQIQEGYCDYYASSMVVLARAAGIPARLVIGYVSGNYDPMTARYIVTEADAHAWPELYFPGYGWIEFEPTGGRPPILRDTEGGEPIWPDTGELEPLVSETGRRQPSLVVGQWLGFALGVAVVLVLIGTGLDSVRLYLAGPTVLSRRLYGRLRRFAFRLRVPSRAGDTPSELKAAFSERLEEIAEAHGFTGIEFLEPAVDEIDAIVTYYIERWYAPQAPVQRSRRLGLIWTWWRLRWRLYLGWMWRRAGLDSGDAETGDVVESRAQAAGAVGSV